MDQPKFYPISYQTESGLIWRGQICSQGGHIVQLSAEYNGRRFPVLEDVSLEQVATKPTSYGCPLLFPNAGRLFGSFTWEQRTYNGLPKRHGLVRHLKWTPLKRGTDHSYLELTLLVEPESQPVRNLFPYDFSMQTRYSLDDTGLTIGVAIRNHGARFPYSFGFHPYLHLPSDCELFLPAQKIMGLTRDKCPNGTSVPVSSLPDFDYQTHRPIKRYLDDIYTGFKSRSGSNTICAISDIREGQEHAINVTFDVMQLPFACIFTPKGRNAICVEPYTSPPNALCHADDPDWHLRDLSNDRSVSYEMHIGLNISAWLQHT